MSDKPATPGASYSVQCVHCSAVLKSPAPVPAGKSVKCPKCQRSFTTPANDPEPSKGHSIQCTHCQAVLKSPAPVPAGKTLTCPKCKQAFTTPGGAPPKLAEKPAPPKPNLNISIFTGDADAAIADLLAESGGGQPAPEASLTDLDDDLVTEEDVDPAKNENQKKKT